MARKKKDTVELTERRRTKRTYLSQTDVPSLPLEQALRVPQAITENYASGPVTPLQLASALKMTLSSSSFKMLCGASIAYGLTNGGYNASQISIEPLGKQIIRPLKEGDDLVAKREAILKPRVLGEFLNKYNGSSLPRDDIAMNVLEEMGVPSDKIRTVYKLILDSAQSVGLLREIKKKKYVDLAEINQSTSPKEEIELEEVELEDNAIPSELPRTSAPVSIQAPSILESTNRKVFITHGKDKDFIDPIKSLLEFGELIPVISVERHTVSKPVPEKVLDDMRSCSAAIIHVTDEMKVMDQEGKEHIIINANVLIEIGAAMALYGRRFILLVKEGVELPSNLQGLYEVRYNGDKLDGDATIKLLKSINDIKNNPLPDRYKKDA